MNRTIRVILALALVFCLVGTLGVTALAEGENELTLIVTGGTGSALGGDGPNFAAAAALRDTYVKSETDSPVLLVDAGGFLPGAAAVMTAAKYDLIVPEEPLTDWDITSISMGVSGLSAGVVFDKNGLQIAFVGVVPMGVQNADEYYGNIQAAVTAARDRGVSYVIILGLVDDAAALIERVAGIDAILTYGPEASVKTLPETVEEEPAEETETEEVEENSEEAESEKEEPAGTMILTVGEKFGTLGVVTIKADGITAENLDAEKLAEKELTLSDAILTLETAVSAAIPEEESVEETEIEETETEATETEETEENGEEAESENEEPAADTETEAPAADGAEENAEAAETETVEETETEAEEPAADAEQTSEPENTEAAENTESTESAEAETNAAPVEPTPVVDPASETDAPAEQTAETESEPAANAAEPETVVWDGEPEQTDSPTDYEKSYDDLQLVFEHPVESVKVGDREFEAKYYDKSEDGKTIKIHADVLNGWTNATYSFVFHFSDGAEDKEVRVEISGTAPAAATPTPTPTPTATPTPTPAPTATPVPAKSAGNSPSTGDTSPILLYVILLAVLVVALVVVIVLVVRKNKRNAKQD